MTAQVNRETFTSARFKKLQEDHPHVKRRIEQSSPVQYKSVKMPHIEAEEYNPDAIQKMKRKLLKEGLDEQVDSIHKRDRDMLFMDMSDEEIMLNYDRFKLMGIV